MSTAFDASPPWGAVTGVDHRSMNTRFPDRARAWPVRPAVGFLHPLEVVKDSELDPAEKREILAAWASDASAVEHRPSHRWLLGTAAPVPLSEVLSALSRLDRDLFS